MGSKKRYQLNSFNFDAHKKNHGAYMITGEGVIYDDQNENKN